MALGVDAPGYCQAEQFVSRRGAEHDRADLDGANPSVPVKLDRKRLSRKLRRWNVGEHAFRIDINRVSPGRLDDGHATIGDVTAEVAGGNDAVLEIVGVEDLF